MRGLDRNMTLTANEVFAVTRCLSVASMRHMITQPERSPANELYCLVAKAREGPLLHIPVQEVLPEALLYANDRRFLHSRRSHQAVGILCNVHMHSAYDTCFLHGSSASQA